MNQFGEFDDHAELALVKMALAGFAAFLDANRSLYEGESALVAERWHATLTKLIEAATERLAAIVEENSP